VKVVITAAGHQRVERKLRGVAAHAADASPVFEPIADGLMEDLRRDIDGRGRRRWKPLSAKTIRNKRRAHEDERPLHASGKLAASITRRDAEGNVLRIKPTELVLGTSIDYAPYVLGPRPVRISSAVRSRSLRLLRAWLLEPWETPS
jgi:hypothetical protein